MGGDQYLPGYFNQSTYQQLSDYRGDKNGAKCGCVTTVRHESHDRNCWTSHESYTTYYLCEIHHNEHVKKLKIEKEDLIKKNLELIKFYDKLDAKIKEILPDKKISTIKDLLRTVDGNISFKKDGSVYVVVSWNIHKHGCDIRNVFLGQIIKENKLYYLKNIQMINACTFIITK
jgi:hypothetical protein